MLSSVNSPGVERVEDWTKNIPKCDTGEFRYTRRAILTTDFVNKWRGNSSSRGDPSEKLTKLMTEILTNGEREFEADYIDYPIALVFGFDDSDVNWDALYGVVDRLLESIGITDFVRFPENAIGIHKDLSNAILFRNRNDAMRFKLAW